MEQNCTTEDDTFRQLWKRPFGEVYPALLEQRRKSGLKDDAELLVSFGWTYKEYMAEWMKRKGL